MANFGVTGGIGAGIMQGLQFMRQREGDARQEQALQNQSAMVDIHKQDQATKIREQDRKGRMLQGYQAIMADPDLSDAERYSKFAREHAKDMTPDEHMAVRKVVEPMVQAFGTDAIHRAVNARDLSGIEKVLSIRAPGSKAAFSGDGKRLVVSTPDARQTDYDWSGFATAHGLYGYLDQQKAQAKSALDARKTEAEIADKLASADLKTRLPQARGVGAGGAGGKSEKVPVDPAAMFGADAYLERFGVGKDADPATRARGDDGYGYYMRLHKSNPGTFNSVDGNEMAFRLSRDLMNGTVKRDTKFDPKTMSWNRYVTDTQGGRYSLDPYGIDPRQLKDPEGKPAIDPAVIEQEEMSALKSFSMSNPTQYGTAAKLAQAKELTTEELMAAAEGKPITSGGRSATLSPAMANVALMIRRRGLEQARPRISTPGGIGRKPLPDTSGYGPGGTKGTSLAGEYFDNYIADPVVGFFKDSAAKARAE
jgi:hypothetical protein